MGVADRGARGRGRCGLARSPRDDRPREPHVARTVEAIFRVARRIGGAARAHGRRLLLLQNGRRDGTRRIDLRRLASCVSRQRARHRVHRVARRRAELRSADSCQRRSLDSRRLSRRRPGNRGRSAESRPRRVADTRSARGRRTKVRRYSVGGGTKVPRYIERRANNGWRADDCALLCDEHGRTSVHAAAAAADRRPPASSADCDRRGRCAGLCVGRAESRRSPRGRRVGDRRRSRQGCVRVEEGREWHACDLSCDCRPCQTGS